KEMRDNWAVGYSRRYTVGVWVGNVTGEPMKNVSGVAGAAPVWLEVMGRLHDRMPSTPPTPPRGVVRRDTAFTASVEPVRAEWFREGTEPVRPTLGPTVVRSLRMAGALPVGSAGTAPLGSAGALPLGSAGAARSGSVG